MSESKLFNTNVLRYTVSGDNIWPRILLTDISPSEEFHDVDISVFALAVSFCEYSTILATHSALQLMFNVISIAT